MKSHIFAAAIVSVVCLPAHASSEYDSVLTEFAQTTIAGWIQDPGLVAAIIAQNTANASLTESDVLGLDTAWRAEVSTGGDLISSVLDNAASGLLRNFGSATGSVTEMFIMDNHGLNVAATDPTSDYWQGDEEKFSETFGIGPGAIHISEIELDESTQTYQAQVSMTIVDPATGAAIGAITVGVNPDALN